MMEEVLYLKPKIIVDANYFNNIVHNKGNIPVELALNNLNRQYEIYVTDVVTGELGKFL